jgi:hypothetical protein
MLYAFVSNHCIAHKPIKLVIHSTCYTYESFFNFPISPPSQPYLVVNTMMGGIDSIQVENGGSDIIGRFA